MNERRDTAAFMAMAGMLSNRGYLDGVIERCGNNEEQAIAKVASMARRLADALVCELDSTEQKAVPSARPIIVSPPLPRRWEISEAEIDELLSGTKR